MCNCCLLLTDEYPRDAEWSGYVEMVDLGFVAVYTVEMLLKMFGFGLRKGELAGIMEDVQLQSQ